MKAIIGFIETCGWLLIFAGIMGCYYYNQAFVDWHNAFLLFMPGGALTVMIARRADR